MAPVLDYWFETVGRTAAGGFPELDPNEIAQLRESGALDHGEHYGSGFVGEARLLSPLGLPPTTVPVTIFHGTADSVVSFESSQRMAAADPMVELIAIADADHGFAIAGDEDLTAPGTKENHRTVYAGLIQRAKMHAEFGK
jgi:pimeloyl-ACP methyl ester carboxylesterase